MEIGFAAPVAGVVQEVRAQRGQQVAAGDVLLVIDPGTRRPVAGAAAPRRLRLPEEADPLDAAVRAGEGGGSARPTSRAPTPRRPTCAASARGGARRGAARAARLRRDAERTERLVALLARAVPTGLSPELRGELAGIRRELCAFADVEQLSSARRARRSPASSARRTTRGCACSCAACAPAAPASPRSSWARAHRARALRRHDLEHGDALERAVLRLLASQHSSAVRTAWCSA